ncbi:MAG: competence/damage-inducible protein A [Bacteroidia bacterium]|nr:competence/damage-inducible protein A [Bacteroidia bacterium]
MEADLITIGDEILIGQIVDTNSAWMAQQLNDEGINVHQITSISDQPEHIISTLNESGKKASLVLVTGGLGPTKDDRTKSALCTFFGTQLIENKEVLEHINQLLIPRGIAINTLNREQAHVPATAIILPNKLGTAPGLLFNHEGTIFVFMPGVPFEMKYLMENEVLPRIKKLFNTSTIIHRTVLTQGLPESILAERIDDWEDSLPECISLAYLPSPESMRLRLSARGDDKEYLSNLLEQNIKELTEIIPGYIFGYEDDTMAGNIGKILKEKGLTVSVAESCTGGNIAHFFTLNPGSSEYFKGGVVAYSNEIKVKLLGIDPQLIAENGAVSKEVVEAMAVAVRQLLQTDYAIATSGIAGPGGGIPEKPVGTVWIAAADSDSVVSKTFNFGNNRKRNIIRSSQTALNMLRLQLLKK